MGIEDAAAGGLLKAALEALPDPVFLIDSEQRVTYLNSRAAALHGDNPESLLRERSGEVVHCVNASGGCGSGEACKTCLVQNTIAEAGEGKAVVRRKARMEWERNGRAEPAYLMITAAPLDHDGKRYVLMVLEDISEIVQLKELIPICAQCKKVRNDKEYWDSIEVYLGKELDINFSHSICPDCMKELYGEELSRKVLRSEGR